MDSQDTHQMAQSHYKDNELSETTKRIQIESKTVASGTLEPEGPTEPTSTTPTPTAGNLCPIEEFLGRTFYVPFLKYCWKIELFVCGVIAADTLLDSNCSNNVHSASLVLSEFEYGNGSQEAYFKSIGPNVFGGQIEFSKDQSVSNVILAPKSVGNGMFLLGLY